MTFTTTLLSFAERDQQKQSAILPTQRDMELPTDHRSDELVTDTEEDPLQILVDADDVQCLIEEATIFNAKEEKTKEIVIEPPVIPQRHTRRVSKFLDSLKLNSIESATQSLNTTQNLIYTSSEEDASSSADDFSDYDYESSSEDSEQDSIRRSQEVTARAVSVVYVGKPCVVNLSSGRRSVSAPMRPKSELLSLSALSSNFEFPPRKSSMVSTSDLPTNSSTSFLGQDPFAGNAYSGRSSTWTREPDSPYPRTPKTPTFGFHRFQKSISLARKRSRQNLKAAAAASSINLGHLDTSSSALEDTVQSSPATTPPAAAQSPVTYNEILRAARRNSVATTAQNAHAEPASPMTPTATSKRGLFSLNVSRRRSAKLL